MKSNNMKKLYQILLVLDDVSDDKRFCRNNQQLNSLYVRGRHNAISVFTSLQYYHSVSPLIRVNATALIVFRIRNQKDLETLLDGLSALVGREIMLQIYKKAVETEYSFLYINLMEKDATKMFYRTFNHRLMPSETSSE